MWGQWQPGSKAAAVAHHHSMQRMRTATVPASPAVLIRIIGSPVDMGNAGCGIWGHVTAVLIRIIGSPLFSSALSIGSDTIKRPTMPMK